MRLGSYELVTELGRGAMGVVWKARHRPTGAERAVKVIELDKSDVDLMHRFDREAKSLARVDGHAHIVRVHETGIEGRHAFYAMDLVEGRSLHAVFAEGPMKPRDACVILAKVARAIAHCHQHGIVHRDLKPENVLIDEAGEPRLVDFGLVRDLLGKKLTYTGTFLGTPAYMAPEQIRGEPAQQASDVHAVGLLLYEALTGARPYGGKTVVEIAQTILAHKYVPIAEKRPDVPVPLARAVERTLNARADARPTARELARDLEAVAKALSGKDTRLVAAGKVRRYRRFVLGLGTLTLLLAVAVALASSRARDEQVDRRLQGRWIASVARARLGLDDAAALLLAREALALEDANGEPQDASLHETVARAALARGTDEFAVAAATSALALAKAPPDELLLVRARARLGLRDVEGVLADLRGIAAPEAARLRVEALLEARRWNELRALEGADPFVAAARALGRFERDMAGASEERIRGLFDDTRREVRGAPGQDAKALLAVLGELRARAEISAVASQVDVHGAEAPSQFNIGTAVAKERKALYRPLETARKELAVALETPRYLDQEGDLDALDLALTVVMAHPEALAEAKEQSRDLALAFEELARRMAGRPEEWLRHRVRTYLALQSLGEFEQGERRKFLEQNRGAATGMVASYLEYGLLEADLHDFVQNSETAREVAAKFREHVGAIDPSLHLSSGDLGLRARMEVLFAEVLVRAATEEPEAREGRLEEAARHAREARQILERSGVVTLSTTVPGQGVLRAEATLALARGGPGSLEAAAACLGEEKVSSDYAMLVLRAEILRRRRDDPGAERLLCSSGAVPEAMNAYTRWFHYDWQVAVELARHALGIPDARERLEALDRERAQHPRLLPWIDRELREVLGRP